MRHLIATLTTALVLLTPAVAVADEGIRPPSERASEAGSTEPQMNPYGMFPLGGMGYPTFGINEALPWALAPSPFDFYPKVTPNVPGLSNTGIPYPWPPEALSHFFEEGQLKELNPNTELDGHNSSSENTSYILGTGRSDRDVTGVLAGNAGELKPGDRELDLLLRAEKSLERWRFDEESGELQLRKQAK